MKHFYATLAALFCIPPVFGRLRVRLTEDTTDNHEGYSFFQSQAHKDWCITEVDSVVGFRLCSFDTQPPSQFWKFGSEGKVHASNNKNLDDQCWWYNSGGGRIQLYDCSSWDNDVTKFKYDATTKQIRLVAHPDLCVTNSGGSADWDDTIHAKPCTNQDRYQWNLVPYTAEPKPPPELEYFLLSSVAGGCMAPKNQHTNKGNKLMLHKCEEESNYMRWRHDDNGLFRNRLKDQKCLQAGNGDSDIKHGTIMRLYDCDENNPIQVFDWQSGGVIQISQGGEDWCANYRGTQANIDRDPIIFSQCANIAKRDPFWNS
mmetsp:Transcript_5461/g.8987  ORF Transcript_5461/g.8987 Transcript_5461/m.8987 type:complete len:315 (-) Transcript_5461:714-1658(-)